nr:reverse transcriptase domain-containing protein [Tanacetum cinerariifolium]
MRRSKRRTPNIVKPELRTIVEMADNHTMDELLQAPTKGYGEAIVILEINADHFEIKLNLLQLVQANPYHGFERENPHTHINNFKMITSTLKFRDVPNDVIKLMIFSYSLEFAQIDTFYNALNDNDQDFLNAAAGGNLLSKTTREALQIIENKSKVRYSRNKPNVSKMNTTSRENASKSDDRIDKIADQISTLVDILAKKVVTPAPVKVVEESCVTFDGAHAYYNCPNTDINQPSVCVATGTYNQVAPQNCASNSWHHLVLLQYKIVKIVERKTDKKTDKEQTNFQGSTAHIQPPVTPIPEPDVLKTLPKPNIPHPLRLNDQKLHEDKLFELAKIPLNENCLVILLKKLPGKFGDPGKFLIPCDFPRMDVCHALADLGVAEDVFVKVEKFHFLTDFVVVDFEADPRVPLILRRSFLRSGRALIDVYGEEITLRVNDEAVTFNLNKTTRYSFTYDDLSNALWPLQCSWDISKVYDEFANFQAGNFIVKGMSSQQKKKFFKDIKHYIWDDPYLFRIFGENHASWLEKLDDALRTAYKTPIGCTPYKLVYGKSFHLPIELEHKAYWALKHVNFDLKTVGNHRKLQLNELNELHDQAYENSLIYKEKTKKIHDSKIKNRIFNFGSFTITKVFPYGTVELSQPDGPNFKVNGHSVKHYFGGDVPQLVVLDLQTSPWTNECRDRVKLM